MKRTNRSPHLTILVRNVSVALMFVALAMALSEAIIRVTRAAGFVALAEAENGSIAGAAAVQTGTNAAGASGGSAVKFGAATGGGCIAPAGAQLQDQSSDDYPIPPWPHTLGSRAVVYFQTSGLPAEYAGYINDGLNTWNQSPCIDARAVSTCPTNSNCVKTTVSNNGSGGVDGEYSERTNGAETIMLSGTLTFYANVLAGESVAQRRVTTIHEMGHAVSLSHRNNRNAIMYGSSGANVSLNPDSVDLNNLLVIYGKAGDATVNNAVGGQGDLLDQFTLEPGTVTRTFR